MATEDAYADLGEQVTAAVEMYGSRAVCGAMGVTDDGLAALMSGGVEMSRGALDGLTRLVRVAGVTQMEEEAPPPRWQPAGPLPDVVTSGLDLDVDVKAEMETGLMRAADSPVSPRWSEQVERRRLSLRGARALAVMTQFRIGITHQDRVAALGLVTQIELALIAYYRESVPDPGVEWDNERRSREIERRLGRLRWVEQERAKEYGGMRGLVNRLQGKSPVSGKELYQKMVEEADRLMEVVDLGPSDPEVVRELMRYSGVDSLDAAR